MSTDSLRLDDGRTVAIRPIEPADRDALRAFFEALTPDSRRLRFHLSSQQLPEPLLHAFTAIDQRDHVALVAQAPASGGEPPPLVAEARYVRHAGSDWAELALVVAEGWRRIGLGKALARTLMRRARRDGIRRLVGETLPDNQRIQGFLRSLGARAMAPADTASVRLCLDL